MRDLPLHEAGFHQFADIRLAHAHAALNRALARAFGNFFAPHLLGAFSAVQIAKHILKRLSDVRIAQNLRIGRHRTGMQVNPRQAEAHIREQRAVFLQELRFRRGDLHAERRQQVLDYQALGDPRHQFVIDLPLVRRVLIDQV